MRSVALLVLLGCATAPDAVAPTSPGPLPPHRTYTLDASPKQQRRLVRPEAFLRAYLQWFGGLAPLDMQHHAPAELFTEWKDYLAALGVPDYHIDIPGAKQSNTMMLATIGRLAEALCVRAVQHDLETATPVDKRLIFRFQDKSGLTLDEFAPRFDMLHRTFLSYPATLAPAGRTAKFFALYQQVASHHAGHPGLPPEHAAWAAICTALVQHPETELY